MGDVTGFDGVPAPVGRILAGWPNLAADADLAALSKLRFREAPAVADRLMSALPAGPLGATEASRLRQLIDILTRLTVAPAPAAVAALRARYKAADRLPSSVATLLEQLAALAAKKSGGGELTRGIGTRGPATARPLPPAPPSAARDVAPTPDGDQPDRFLRADIEDHDLSTPLTVGEQYSVAVDVSPDKSPLSGGFSSAGLPDPGEGLIELTVQLTSTDFEMLDDTLRPLRLPRTGPSRGKARFDVSPQHTGQCGLSATVAYQGNFVSQLRLGIPVGQPGEFTAETVGRPVDSAAVLEPRDLSLVIRPDTAGGYSCIALGSVGNEATLPLSVDDMANAAADARADLTAVVTGVFGGTQPFLDGIDIPDAVQQAALTQLARSGKRLFQRLFQAPGAGADAKAMGDWLVEYATDPQLQLTLQVFATRVPIPWSMLYLGDVRDGAVLDWNNFLGFRHIIEQLPFQSLPGTKSNQIDSQPDLSVSVNINPKIDSSMGIDVVAAHQQHWVDIAAARKNLALVPRATLAEVVGALADPANVDKVVYFYCHAQSNDVDPDKAAIIMGGPRDKDQVATLADLNLDAPTDIPLAGRPLVFLNACESADLSPRFYDGFVPFFLAKGSRGVIGTECKTPVVFAIHWAEAFVDRLLAGAPVGQTMLDLRRQFLHDHGNPMGLLYTMYCDADTRIAPPL